MKYLVLSDSHGNVDNMARAVEREKPDGIIHLGDCWRDAEELHELFPACRLSRCRATVTLVALRRSSACSS